MEGLIEKLEYALILLDDALKRYDKSAALVQEAFESVIDSHPQGIQENFHTKAADSHRTKAIRKMALVLESMSKDDLRQRIFESETEVHHLITFLRTAK